MKRLAFILFLLVPVLLLGQNKRFKNPEFKTEETSLLAWTNPKYDKNGLLTAVIEIIMPFNDSTVLFAGDGVIGAPSQPEPGIWLVHVAEGTKSIRISAPDFYTFDYSFPVFLKKEKTYTMQLRSEDVLKLRTMVTPLFSYMTSQPSFGVMLALCKIHGGYNKAKTNFVFGVNPTSECDAEGMINGVKGWFTGESTSSRFSLTAGYMYRLFQTSKNIALYAYIGGGYGERILAWQAYGQDGEYEYVKVTPRSFQGWEAETGIVFRAGDFALMGGVQTNQFKFVEFNIGIGFML